MKVTRVFVILAALLGASAWGQTNVYDLEGRLVRVIYPAGKATLYEYDAADNLLSVQNVDVPTAPNGLSVERTAVDASQLTWADNSDSESGYRIQRRKAFGYTWQDVVDLEADVTSYQDTGLVTESAYVYRVLALGDGDLTSSFSAEVAAAGGESLAFNLKKVRYVSDAAPYPIEVEFETEDGARYRLESSSTLEDDSWIAASFALSPNAANVQTELAGTGLMAIVYIGISNDPIFYRLVRADEK